MGSQNKIWIFGYGSLIWKPHFNYLRAVSGFVDGYERRFWQGSPDHRGTVESPGRVVTLSKRENARCWGVAFELEGQEFHAIEASLDHRERGGYEKIAVSVILNDFTQIEAIVYFAGEQNPHYLGPASISDMIKQIKHSCGESGENRDYVLNLQKALKSLGVFDEHVHQLCDGLHFARTQE